MNKKISLYLKVKLVLKSNKMDWRFFDYIFIALIKAIKNVLQCKSELEL